MSSSYLDHLGDELINQVLSVAPITTTSFVETVSLGDETSTRRVQLEGPQESVDFLEVWPDSEDLVNDIFGSMDAQVAELLRDHLVIGKRDPGSIDLEISSLIHQLSNCCK